MALKAGYYGVKKNVADELKKLDGAKIIKSVGAGLNLSSQGALSCKSATASQAGIAKSSDYLSSSMLAQLPLSFTEDIETSEINGIEVQFDTTPSDNSGDIAYNLITSKGVYDALQTKLGIIDTLLTSTDDLDNITTTGIYRVESSKPVHSPEDIGWYALVVYEVAHMSETYPNIIQVIYKGGTMYMRNYAGTPVAWTGWYKFAGSIVT